LISLRRETGEQEFEKIKAYYYELQSDSTSQSEALKHASKKLVNINQRFSLCEDALRETDTLLEKIQASLESAKVQDLDNVKRYEEISEALEKTRILVSGWSEKIERLEFESNIMKTDLKSLENSSPDPNSKNGHLKKSPEDQSKAGLIKVAEPVMLSTHLYIEALEQKVREVNELKRAFLELAVAATDEIVPFVYKSSF
jgi:chromosome segregation ATPase